MRPVLLLRSLSLLIALPFSASAQEFWVLPEGIEGQVSVAKTLYDVEHPYDPFLPTVIDAPAPELSALYAALAQRNAPAVTLLDPLAVQDDETPSIDYRSIPTTFAPGSAEAVIVGYIQRFESSSAGYDAVWHGNRTPLPARPTEMTICEVRDWQLNARRYQQSTAIGLYQIVGGTYRRLLDVMDMPCDILFDAQTQDRMGLALLYGRNWEAFKAGSISPEDFGFELAGEWAAFPAPYGPKRGRSRHDGIAGNRHLVELPQYLAFLTDLQQRIQSGELDQTEAQLDLVVLEGSETAPLPYSSSASSDDAVTVQLFLAQE